MTKIDYIVHQLTAGSYYTEGGTMITCPDHMERQRRWKGWRRAERAAAKCGRGCDF